MGLQTDFRFSANYALGETNFIYIRGALFNDPQAIAEAWYQLTPPSYSLDGVIVEPPVTLLTWQATTAPSEGQTVLADCGWFTVGSRQNKETGLIEPYGLAGLPFQPVTFEEGYNYSLLMFFFQSIGRNEMAGTLGKYNYVDDKGTNYVMRMDASNATAIGNTAAAADAVVNLPGRLRVRYLLAEQTDNPKVKRRIPVGAGSNTNYINGGTISLETVAGAKNFRITGRVGEKFSF